MKMKISDRLTLWFGGFATLLTGILSLIGGFVIIKYCTYEHDLLRILPYVMIGFGVFACYMGSYSIWLPRRYHPCRRAFISQATEHGELRIAVSAIENLILRCVGTHKEVKVLAMQLHNRRGVVSVDLRLSMSGNISIPQAVEQLQTQLKRYLAASSGIDLRDIRVSVEGTDGEDAVNMPVEPLPPAAEIMAAAAVAVSEEEEVTMHQRVFGRDTTKTAVEQVEEAEVIAPPAEEAPEAEEVVEEAEVEAEAEAEAVETAIECVCEEPAVEEPEMEEAECEQEPCEECEDVQEEETEACEEIVMEAEEEISELAEMVEETEAEAEMEEAEVEPEAEEEVFAEDKMDAEEETEEETGEDFLVEEEEEIPAKEDDAEAQE